jgi:hypothetical protein
MNEEQKAKLEHHLPIRMIVRLQDGKVQGLTEESFSMNWSDSRVNVFWSGKAYSMLGEHQLNGVKSAEHNSKPNDPNELIIDPLAEDSPIEVDWDKWLSATNKYDKRNAPFVVKSHGTWQLRAISAERQVAKHKTLAEQYQAYYQEEADKVNKINAILNPPEETEE